MDEFNYIVAKKRLQKEDSQIDKESNKKFNGRKYREGRASRKCLKCTKIFSSSWVGNRMCDNCLKFVSNIPFDRDHLLISS